jgi:uncharacterized membrane protein HdeD (DUF308 family)
MPEKLEEKLKSDKYNLIISFIYVVLGILILAWPHISLSLMGTPAAISMLVIGTVNIVLYFSQKDKNREVAGGVTAAAFGIYILMHPSSVNTIIPFGVGVLILIGAMLKFEYASDMKKIGVRGWKTPMFFALVLIALGIFLLAQPMKELKAYLYMIAIALILDGGVNAASHFFLKRRIRSLRKGIDPYAKRDAAAAARKAEAERKAAEEQQRKAEEEKRKAEEEQQRKAEEERRKAAQAETAKPSSGITQSRQYPNSYETPEENPVPEDSAPDGLPSGADTEENSGRKDLFDAGDGDKT